MNISRNLRSLMDDRGVNVTKLSEMSSVPAPRICDLRNGKVKNPRIQTVKKLSGALGVSLDDFVKE